MGQYSSLFSQMLGLFSRLEFEQCVRRRRAEYKAKGFSCWQQFVAMLFCHMGRAWSLHEITRGLATCEGKLRHLGVTVPKKSTLAYANEHRPWELYQDIFLQLLAKTKVLAGATKRAFRFKAKLYSLDATVIDLCLSLYEWAQFRRTKGAIKLHLRLDHDGYLPDFAWITAGKRHEVTVARQSRFQAGSIVVFDKGYTDYGFFAQLQAWGAFFVTRLKENTVYEVVSRWTVPERSDVLSDVLIRLTGFYARQDCPQLLRVVTYYDRHENRVFQFLTNNLKLAGTTIAAIYRERWQIELFFKALKQYLKIKTFVGTSANAVKIQIWTALIAMLLYKYLQLRSSFSWALSNLVALLRFNLFTYRDLWQWINQPFDTPPLRPSPLQLTLDLA